MLWVWYTSLLSLQRKTNKFYLPWAFLQANKRAVGLCKYLPFFAIMPPTQELRERAVQLLAGGSTQKGVALHLGVGLRSVERWWALHKKGESLKGKPIPGRPSSISPIAKQVISLSLGKKAIPPKNWLPDFLQRVTQLVGRRSGSIWRILLVQSHTKWSPNPCWQTRWRPRGLSLPRPSYPGP